VCRNRSTDLRTGRRHNGDWCLQRDLVVLPKSTHRERIKQNAQVFDFTLSDDDMAALDALDTTGGTDRARTQMVVTAASRAKRQLPVRRLEKRLTGVRAARVLFPGVRPGPRADVPA